MHTVGVKNTNVISYETDIRVYIKAQDNIFDDLAQSLVVSEDLIS